MNGAGETLRRVCLAGLLLSAGAAPAATTLRTCVDDRAWLPYTTPDPQRPGEVQLMLLQVAAKLGFVIDNRPLPWRRCQEEVRLGRIDAMVGAAYVDFNRDIAAFPLLGGEADASRSLAFARAVLVRRKGNRANWDGRRFTHLDKAVGTAAGTLITGDAVERGGGRADAGARTDSQNLSKLLEERIDLMAGYEADVQSLLAANPQAKVEVLPVPLIEAAYYLAFAKPYAAQHPELVGHIWREIARLRRSKH